MLAISSILSASAQSPVAAPGWTSLGIMPAPTWDGKTLLFQSNQGTLAITPLANDVFRVRFTIQPAFGRDHSYAVINRDVGTLHVKADIGSAAATLTTPSLKVTVQYAPLRISFANASGEVLDADDPGRGMSFADSEFRIAKQLHVTTC